MKNNIFVRIKNTIKFFFSSILALPSLAKNKMLDFKNECQNLRSKLGNIANSNMELGIYHLMAGNYNDAIFRFKLIEKYLEPSNKLASYWLGWCYFLKQNYPKAIINLNNAAGEDKLGLSQFILNIDKAESIPSSIYAMCRDIIANKFAENFINSEVNIPEFMICKLNNIIKNLPENYTILEIGSNIGIVGHEINSRMQEKFILNSTEISKKMIDSQSILYPEKNLYSQIINMHPLEYILSAKEKYDIIVSLEGLNFSSELEKVFKDIYLVINKNGYFAFGLYIAENTHFSGKLLCFTFSRLEVITNLQKTGFNIISEKIFTLKEKIGYTVFFCKKQS